MSINERLKGLVDQMPEADGRGMLTENIDKEKIERAIAAIHTGGVEFVGGLIDMLAEPGSEADVKPRYALHALANHVLLIKDEAARKQLCETLAAALDGDRPRYVKAFLCEELRWAGRGESVAALGKLLHDDELCAPASMALVAIREDAADALVAAWPNAAGKARLQILHALAALDEPAAAKLFAAALEDSDREIRVAAAAGLGRLGDPSAAEAILKVADRAQGWERTQVTKHCVVLAERSAAGGNPQAARRIYDRLLQSRTDATEGHVREAARRGLAALDRSGRS